jgi:hypothetical protein
MATEKEKKAWREYAANNRAKYLAWSRGWKSTEKGPTHTEFNKQFEADRKAAKAEAKAAKAAKKSERKPRAAKPKSERKPRAKAEPKARKGSKFTAEREARIQQIITERSCSRRNAIRQLWNEEAVNQADAKKVHDPLAQATPVTA